MADMVVKLSLPLCISTKRLVVETMLPKGVQQLHLCFAMDILVANAFRLDSRCYIISHTLFALVDLLKVWDVGMLHSI